MEIRTFSYEPLVFCRFFSCQQYALVEFFGALDGEEFFVIGVWRGRGES